jgi:hypothetical protein
VTALCRKEFEYLVAAWRSAVHSGVALELNHEHSRCQNSPYDILMFYLWPSVGEDYFIEYFFTFWYFKYVHFEMKIKRIKEKKNILIKMEGFVLQNLDSFKRPHLMAYKAAGSPPLVYSSAAEYVLFHSLTVTPQWLWPPGIGQWYLFYNTYNGYTATPRYSRISVVFSIPDVIVIPP